MRTPNITIVTAIELKFGKRFFAGRALSPLQDNPDVYSNINIDNTMDYGTSDFYENFSKSELLLYFRGLNVDVPRSLTPIASYRRTASKTKLARFNNYFQREGKKLRFMLLLLKAYDQVFNATHLSAVHSGMAVCHWREISSLVSFSSWQKNTFVENCLPHSQPTLFHTI